MRTSYATEPERLEVYALPGGGSQAFLRTEIRQEDADDDRQERWTADEYTVRSQHRPERLRQKIERDFGLWLEFARANQPVEAEAPDLLEIMADHEERICLMEMGVEL